MQNKQTILKSAGIIGVGKALPDKIVTNEDFVKLGLDTSDKWITERTGIKERRIAEPGMGTADLAVKAGQAALDNAGLTPQEIDLVIVATTTPDYPLFPSTACLVQDRLGIKKVGAFDVSAACTGFNYALTTAAQFIGTGFAKNILVIGADCLSKYVDWTDRSVCILFGDGAGAVVVSEVSEGYGILASDLNANGAEGDILITKGGGSKKPFSAEMLKDKSHFVFMNGKALYKVVINSIIPTIENTLKKVNLTSKDIDYMVPHQANLRIIEYARKKLGLKKDQVYINIQKYGNTSSASIPIALAEAVSLGKIKEDSLLLSVGFGGGFTWASNIIRWGGIKKG
ncbi:ketoacyl-ACP synthase III [bacterium]|nr:ketoacyl-ACP synthase III [bacterium]